MLAAVAFISVAVDAYAERVNVGNLWFETDPATGTARVASPQEGDLTFDMVEKVYSSDNVIVPSSIEHDGIIFTVTSVGPLHFQSQKSNLFLCLLLLSQSSLRHSEGQVKLKRS